MASLLQSKGVVSLLYSKWGTIKGWSTWGLNGRRLLCHIWTTLVKGGPEQKTAKTSRGPGMTECLVTQEGLS